MKKGKKPFFKPKDHSASSETESDVDEFIGCTISFETTNGEVYQGVIIAVDAKERWVTLDKPYLNCRAMSKPSIKLYGHQLKNLAVLNLPEVKNQMSRRLPTDLGSKKAEINRQDCSTSRDQTIRYASFTGSRPTNSMNRRPSADRGLKNRQDHSTSRGSFRGQTSRHASLIDSRPTNSMNRRQIDRGPKKKDRIQPQKTEIQQHRSTSRGSFCGQTIRHASPIGSRPKNSMNRRQIDRGLKKKDRIQPQKTEIQQHRSTSRGSLRSQKSRCTSPYENRPKKLMRSYQNSTDRGPRKTDINRQHRSRSKSSRGQSNRLAPPENNRPENLVQSQIPADEKISLKKPATKETKEIKAQRNIFKNAVSQTMGGDIGVLNNLSVQALHQKTGRKCPLNNEAKIKVKPNSSSNQAKVPIEEVSTKLNALEIKVSGEESRGLKALLSDA